MKPGDLIADRFEIERLAGSGGMGAVYLARDRRREGSPVAVKVLWGHFADQPEHAERFTREAQVLQELSHPGIVRYLDHGTTADAEPWLALEWLEGESLAQRLRRQGLGTRESLLLALRVAEALAVAHARGIVHRDLKPSNLQLVGGEVGQVKVLDFGIAKVAGGAPLTMTGVVIGTPFYMAPEQARGERRIDARADVFALGCVLFHCLTGKAPFAGEELHVALLKVVLEDAPRLSDLREGVPPALDDLVARMLARAPKDRPADAAAVAAALAALEPASGAPSADLGGPVSARATALTGREVRVVCAVLLRVDEADRDLASALDAAAAAQKTRLERLPNGVLAALVSTAGAATDQAARAALCALGLRAVAPTAPMALAAGRGVPTGRLPGGEILDRGLSLLDLPSEGAPIRLDEVAAGLLGARFEVGGDAAGLILRGERDALPSARTLLGRPTPFVGRDHELGILEAVLEECVSEPSTRAVLVTAGAGVGKSRLYQELGRRIEERRGEGGLPVQLWVAQGDPISAGSPFGMIGQMLRREANVQQGEPREVRRQKLRARVARHLPPRDAARVSEFLGELAGVSFPDAESLELRAARRDPMLMGDQIRRAWEELLAAECSAHALVLVLEDLHWGDLSSVKLCDAALRALDGRPLFALALGRPEVHDLFPRMWAERGVQELHLRELGRRGSEKLVREVLGPAFDDAAVKRIVDRAAGNAFYLEELIRAASTGAGEDLPETVLAMVQARLEALGPEARRVLRAASVFGQVFWRGALRPLLGGALDEAALGALLGELEERELLARRGEGRFPAEEEYAFRHALVREAAYASLTEGDRLLGHQLAAAWLEAAGEREATILAEHFERGGEPERAIAWYRRAAEQALGGNDFAAAIQRAEQGALYASGETLGALKLLQAEAHKWLGSAAEAEQAALEAMQRFALGSPLWYVAAAEAASMRLRLGRHAELAALAEEVRAQGLVVVEGSPTWGLRPHTPEGPAPAGGAPKVSLRSTAPTGAGPSSAPGPGPGAAVSAVARLAGSLLHDGQHALAESLIAEVDRVAGPLSERDYAVAARLYALHASRALCYGDPAAALRHTELSIPSFAFTGDRRNACLGRVNAGHAMLQLGAFAPAERALRSALVDAERMGLHNVSALARQNLGPALARQGLLDEAAALERGALATFAEQENRRQAGRAGVYLAQILALRGELAEAEATALAAEATLATIPPLRAFALAVLAAVRLPRGPGEGALQAAREAVELLLATGGMEEGESLVRLVYAESLLAAGHRAAAEDAVDVARGRLLARAGRIVDPAWRASFCENVPENARTLALAGELLAGDWEIQTRI